MTYRYKALGLAATVALAPIVASAATVDIEFQNFGTGSVADINNATAALDAFMGSTPIAGTEDFEGFTACNNVVVCDSSPVGNISPIESTAVGNFSGIGPTHTGGGSQVTPADHIVIRTNNPTNTFSRYDVVGDTNWLDSNDVNGILWEIPGASGLSQIVKIAFFLTDADDVGTVAFEINAAGGEVVSQNVIGNVGGVNGGLDLVTMLFDGPVDIVDIRMINGEGDGFGIDGIEVGTIPLPASALLLLGGLGGLGGLSVLRRRKRAA